MKHETKKICKIVDELTTLLLKEGSGLIEFKINRLSDRTVISIVDHHTHYSQKEVDDMIECFNVQRQFEVEEYYWQLVGESDNDSELTIVGVMVDHADVKLENGDLHIDLIRLNKN